MPHLKNTICKDAICEANVDLTESLNWSLLEERIGENLNTLESASGSGLSSSDNISGKLESKKIFETFTSNLKHDTTPNTGVSQE